MKLNKSKIQLRLFDVLDELRKEGEIWAAYPDTIAACKQLERDGLVKFSGQKRGNISVDFHHYRLND